MVSSSTHTLTLISPPDDVNSVHALLETVWADAAHVSPTDRFSFETALIELASNVLRHADTGCGVTCGLRLEVSEDRIDARLIDTGAIVTELLAATDRPTDAPIDTEAALAGVLDTREMPDALCESGRGIALIQALVDELDYVRDGDVNHWHIVRTLRS